MFNVFAATPQTVAHVKNFKKVAVMHICLKVKVILQLWHTIN